MKSFYLLIFAACLLLAPAFSFREEVPSGEFFNFKFKGKRHELAARSALDTTRFSAKSAMNDGRLDTASNIFYQSKNYIEIIRQDERIRPMVGVALGFEFDESNGEFPYTPARAVIQIKDFRYGGVMFEKRDSLNFTGVSNSVSDDLDIEILGFQEDTIVGQFKGLLLNGAGGMAEVREGKFKIKLFRK